MLPAREMPEMLSGAWPVLLRVVVCGAEVVPAVVEKLSDAGESEARGATPVPVTAKDWCLKEQSPQFESKGWNEIVALYDWAAVGVNVTERLQVAAGATGLAQLPCATPNALSDELAEPRMMNSELLVFVRVTVSGAPTRFTAWVPKLSAAGEIDITGVWGIAVPVRVRVCAV